MQMGSFDWRWRECLLAVSVNYHAVSVLGGYLPNIAKKFQLLLLQEFALIARGMATAVADGHDVASSDVTARPPPRQPRRRDGGV